MKSYELDVTAEIIARGRKKDPENCPVTIAYREQHPRIAATSTLLIYRHTDMLVFTLQFDAGKEVTPQKFTFTENCLRFPKADWPDTNRMEKRE